MKQNSKWNQFQHFFLYWSYKNGSAAKPALRVPKQGYEAGGRHNQVPGLHSYRRGSAWSVIYSIGMEQILWLKSTFFMKAFQRNYCNVLSVLPAGLPTYWSFKKTYTLIGNFLL